MCEVRRGIHCVIILASLYSYMFIYIKFCHIWTGCVYTSCWFANKKGLLKKGIICSNQSIKKCMFCIWTQLYCLTEVSLELWAEEWGKVYLSSSKVNPKHTFNVNRDYLCVRTCVTLSNGKKIIKANDLQQVEMSCTRNNQWWLCVAPFIWC